jgi:hypothetical protein
MSRTRPTITRRKQNHPWQDWCDSHHHDPHREPYDPNRTPLTLPLANFVGDLLDGMGMPKFAVAGTQRTYAAWPVWRDSTTKQVKFMPLPKKRAVRIYHKARAFERQTRQRGKQDGALGRNGLAALHALLFDFINYATGRLDPAQATIARAANISLASVKRGLRNLKAAGVLHWVRRAAETRDEHGRFCEEQDTNAYGIIPPSQWLGFFDPLPDAPPPHPSEWGATPPLPGQLDQASPLFTGDDGRRKTAAELQADGSIRTIVNALEADPADELALANARLGRTLFGLEPEQNR